jgi:hypothetical protein
VRAREPIGEEGACHVLASRERIVRENKGIKQSALFRAHGEAGG